MESTITPGIVETASLSANSNQNTRYKERVAIESDSVVKNEAVFFSPVIKIDRSTQQAIFQYRDSKTGEVNQEYPNPKQVNKYRQPVESKASDISEEDHSSKETAEAPEIKAPEIKAVAAANVSVKEDVSSSDAPIAEEKPAAQHVDQDV